MHRSDVQDIEIPENVFVHCPKANFVQVRMKTRCIGCEHFKGFLDMDPQRQEAPFAQRYQVVCAHPMTRRVSVVDTRD